MSTDGERDELEGREREPVSVEHPEFRGLTGEPLTWEGQIRLLGRLGKGASSLPRWARWIMTGVLIAAAFAWVVVVIIGFVRLGL